MAHELNVLHLAGITAFGEAVFEAGVTRRLHRQVTPWTHASGLTKFSVRIRC